MSSYHLLKKSLDWRASLYTSSLTSSFSFSIQIKLIITFSFQDLSILSRVFPSAFVYTFITPSVSTYLLYISLLFVGKLSDDSCGEIKRARRNGVNKGKKEKEVSVGESLEKGRIFNHERRGVYARGFSRELATFVARVVYTRGHSRLSGFVLYRPLKTRTANIVSARERNARWKELRLSRGKRRRRWRRRRILVAGGKIPKDIASARH